MAKSAGFLGKKHADKTREKIQVSHIVNRLNSAAKGELELTPTQLRAAEILLKKALPDLQSISITGEDGGPVRIDHAFAVQPVSAKSRKTAA